MKKAFAVIFCLMLIITNASAHAGRTDANGGHWDRSTGEYHYHHGYPAHQHTDGICPYEYDDQTGATSGSSSSSGVSSGTVFAAENKPVDSGSETVESNPTEPQTAPDGYPDAVNYEIATGSKLIDRTYYFNDNGFMYIPWSKENMPHGDIETDNTTFLQFGSPYIGDVIYKYGLENQSRQFQEGATFGLHEAQCYYDYWYQYGYEDGQESVAADIEDGYDSTYNEGYDAGFDAGKSQGDSQSYSAGYDDAENKYQWIIIIAAVIAITLFCLLIRCLRKGNEELSKCQKQYESLRKSYNEQNTLLAEERQGWSQAVQSRDAKIQNLQAQIAKWQVHSPYTMTFGGWQPEIHQTQAQYDRFQRSLDPRLKLIGKSGNFYKVQGTTGIYDVTLDSCNCPDFLSNLHGQSPCKHIYFLARECGVPVNAIYLNSSYDPE